MKQFILSFFSLGFSVQCVAQTTDSAVSKSSLAINVGLIQPIMLKGGNAELDFRYHNFIVSYSHGWSLDMSGNTITGAAKEQNVSIHIPNSFGFGIGYSYPINHNLIMDLRLEPKWHKFEVTYKDHNDAQYVVADYKTFTLGAGLYATYIPFSTKKAFIKGFNVSASMRYWPKISSSLQNNQLEYYNTYTGNNEIHKAANIGIANTPFIFNFSVGYILIFD